MLTHIVLFRFEDLAHAEQAGERLRQMKGKIPTLLDVEAGVDITRSGRSYELALITRHADSAGLDAYQIHPVHQAVVTYIKTVASGSVAVDFFAK
jgi:hypothetical protein